MITGRKRQTEQKSPISANFMINICQTRIRNLPLCEINVTKVLQIWCVWLWKTNTGLLLCIEKIEYLILPQPDAPDLENWRQIDILQWRISDSGLADCNREISENWLLFLYPSIFLSSTKKIAVENIFRGENTKKNTHLKNNNNNKQKKLFFKLQIICQQQQQQQNVVGIAVHPPKLCQACKHNSLRRIALI